MAESPRNRMHDISMPLTRHTPVWPSSEPVAIRWLKNHAEHGYSESTLSLNVHSGTHIDFPYHFMAEGRRGGDVTPEAFLGECYVLDCGVADVVDRALLERVELPAGCRRLLLKTRNSLMGAQSFTEEYVSLTPDGAQWLVQQKVSLVGIDYLSIEAYGSDGRTHKTLLGNDILVLEGLVLADVAQGRYHLIALPLNIPEAESAPVRAILLEGDLP